MILGSDGKKRCFGISALYADYHDQEWGQPVHDDRLLFELLCLEGAQAGLSWEIVLKKREHYRHFFHQFDPLRVASMEDAVLEQLCTCPLIIRHRLKIYGIRQNAKVFLEIQQEFSSFDHYVWKFVSYKPIVTRRTSLKDLPTKIPESIALSKDLRKRGMTFVGPTIMYAYMQAIGMVDDHLQECWCAQSP